MKKVIICFYGTVSRSIKYTYKNLQNKLIDVVKEKYDVDTYMFNNNVNDELVDKRKLNNNDINLLKTKYFNEKSQIDIDNDISIKVRDEKINVKMRKIIQIKILKIV